MNALFPDHKAKDIKKLLVRRLLLPRYLGSTYECPVCGTRLREFKPIWKSFPRKLAEHGFVYPLERFETMNWDSYQCPSCDCSDRERLYALYIKQWLAAPRPPGERRRIIVEFAPSLSLSHWLRRTPNIEYRSADLYRPKVDDKVDITKMSLYGNDSVDVFVCSHVLEHIADDRSAMSELFRILRPDGFGIVMVPLISGVDETHEDATITDPGLRWKFFGQDDHVRLYGKADFVRRLGRAGFKVLQLGEDYFGPATFQRSGIGRNAVLYVVTK